jgi:SNF2 family DNA or RNA helicase
MNDKTKKEVEVGKLQPQQSRAIKKLDRSGGIVLDHSTGSGKTRTFLEAIQRYQDEEKGGKSLLVAPASLVKNVDHEIKKHNLKIDRSRLTVLSYEKATAMEDELSKQHFHTVVMDEAHKLRNVGTKRHQALSEIVSGAKRRVLATATPIYNKPSDMAPLYNIAAGRDILPKDPKTFDNMYLAKIQESPTLMQKLLGAKSKEVTHLKNIKQLHNIIKDYVDHYDLEDDPESMKHFPTKSEKIIQVEMSPEQHRVYRYLEGQLPFHLRMKVRMNLPLDKKESSQLNAFSSGIRQVSNSVHPFMPQYDHISPKIQTATDNLEKKMKSDKNFRGLVYSNYLGAGLDDYSKTLTSKGIAHSLYTGKLTAAQKDQLVQDYNSGKTPVLLVSSSGAEGLNLKGTKLIQTLEPHFNHSKIKQVVGRGVRYKSHEHLPANERHVDVEMYHSIFPKTMLGKSKSHSIDQYLQENSDHKGDLTNEIKELVKKNN